MLLACWSSSTPDAGFGQGNVNDAVADLVGERDEPLEQLERNARTADGSSARRREIDVGQSVRLGERAGADYGETVRHSVSERTRDSSSCGLNGFVT